MRATIITLVLAAIFSVGNISTIVASDDKDLYSNTEVDPETNTSTTTFYRTSKSMNTVLEKQIVVKHDENNNPVEKTIYKWSQVSKKWIPVQKQSFEYNSLNLMASSNLTRWDAKKNDWEKKTQYVEYTYSDNGEMLSAVNK